jgi:glucose/arabinose dehydrogenase
VQGLAVAFVRFRSQHQLYRRLEFRPRLELLEDRALLTQLPAGFVETPFASGLTKPTCMAFAPDGRLFVCEQDGTIQVIQPNGTLAPRPFLRVNVDNRGEWGLLGMAFHPDFADNGHVYIYYIVATAPFHGRVSRFTASDVNPNVAQHDSEQVILELDNLTDVSGNHVGGPLNFGADGNLYIAVGEDENPSNSQNPGNLLGKMLRIHDDGTVPADNPFVGLPGVRGEIYALGLRNPFGAAVQPLTGRIFVNDVGSGGAQAREEVNQLWYGGNYGWPIYEGIVGDPDFTDPLHTYQHGTDPETGSFNCAITGGTFYGPGVRQFPREYVGDYFFTEFCGGWIRRRDAHTGAVTVFASNTANTPIDLAVDSQGSLFYVSYAGAVYRIQYVGAAPIVGGVIVSPAPAGLEASHPVWSTRKALPDIESIARDTNDPAPAGRILRSARLSRADALRTGLDDVLGE